MNDYSDWTREELQSQLHYKDAQAERLSLIIKNKPTSCALLDAEHKGIDLVAREVIRELERIQQELAMGHFVHRTEVLVSVLEGLSRCLSNEEMLQLTRSVHCTDDDCHNVLSHDDEKSGAEGMCLSCTLRQANRQAKPKESENASSHRRATHRAPNH